MVNLSGSLPKRVAVRPWGRFCGVAEEGFCAIQLAPTGGWQTSRSSSMCDKARTRRANQVDLLAVLWNQLKKIR